jgi:lipoprotein NlpD
MNWLNWKHIKKSSLLITPNLHDTTTTKHNVSLLKAFLYVSLYTLVAWLVLIFILAVSPLKDFIFVIENQELKAQKEKIIELQSKVEVLTNQLQMVASTNERMKFALKLAKKDSIKTDDPLYDSLKNRINKKLQIEGNIYKVYKILAEFLFGEQSTIFREPITGIVTQNYNEAKGHLGIDYGAKVGSPVFASAGGLVIFSDYTYDDGYMMIIQHENEYLSIYKHCSSLLKKQREFIRQGEMIALSGNSGKNTSGPHLHFEIWKKGKPVNPMELIIK